MCYPLYCHSFAAVAKSLSRFALLKHIHEPEVLARLIVKVVLHDDRRIPPDVVVSMGAGPGTKSWTVPVYVLSRQDIVIPQDKQPIPPNGLAHPIPPEAPGWAWQMQPPLAPAQDPKALAAELSEVGKASVGNVHNDAMEQDQGLSDAASDALHEDSAAGQENSEQGMQPNEEGMQSADSVEDIDLRDNYVPPACDANAQMAAHQQNLDGDAGLVPLAMDLLNDEPAAPDLGLMPISSAARALLQPEDQVRLNSIFFKLPTICPDQSIISSISHLFTNLDAPIPLYLDDFDDLLRLMKVAVDVKKQVIAEKRVAEPEDASSNDVEITDASAFTKKKNKKWHVHHSRAPMDVAFQRRSSRTTPSLYRKADLAPVAVEPEKESETEPEAEPIDNMAMVLVENPTPL